MELLFLDASYSGEVKLCRATLDYLKKKKIRSVALYASVQFCNKLEVVKQQLQKMNIAVVSSQPDRTHVQHQLLGCDNYHDSLHLSVKQKAAFDCYLYVGDGKFHPLALVYGQKDLAPEEVKEIVCNDPIAKKLSLMSFNDIKGILRKYRGSLLKFLSTDTIGVLVTIKPGQEQFRPGLLLEKKFPNKKFYYFIDNIISFDQLENFPFIQTWINTACPRIGFDDQEKFRRGVINLNDAFRAEEILSTESALNKI